MDSLKEKGKYIEAIQLLEEFKTDQQSEEYKITKHLALLYGMIGKYEKSFKLWNYGHIKGYFFGLFPHFPVYKSFKEYTLFDSISKEDMRIRKDSLENSKTTYEIFTPDGYRSEIKYPLFVILHGGGSSVKKEKEYWKFEYFQNEFIVAFIQSYLYYDMETFGWQIADERGRNDLIKCCNEIKDIYSIDTGKVIIGGISAGGYMAMDLSINKFIQTAGFIAVCPDVMAEDFSTESIENAKISGIRGVIISGENDYNRKNNEKLLKKLKEVDFKCIYEVVPGIGHQYPPDFEILIKSLLNILL